MSHPLLQTRHFIAYILVWLVLALSQTTMTIRVMGAHWDVALLDAFLAHLWAAILGISLWYALAYHIFKHSFYATLLHHLFLGNIFAFIWAGTLQTLFSAIYSDNPALLETLQSAHPWRIGLGGIYYILLVLVYSLFQSMNSLRERIENEARLRELLQKSELNLLKSQLNPHFLFNSLNSLSALISFAPEKAERMVTSLAEYLRYSIAAPAHNNVPLEEELKNIRLYLAIEQIRFADKLQLQEEIPPEVLQIRVPSMILQPVYENAIKHGVSENTGPSVISTRIYLQQDYLQIEIHNTLKQASTRKGTGLGLRNVHERLRLMYGEHRSKLQHGISEQGYTVQITLPRHG